MNEARIDGINWDAIVKSKGVDLNEDIVESNLRYCFYQGLFGE